MMVYEKSSEYFDVCVLDLLWCAELQAIVYGCWSTLMSVESILLWCTKLQAIVYGGSCEYIDVCEVHLLVVY